MSCLTPSHDRLLPRFEGPAHRRAWLTTPFRPVAMQEHAIRAEALRDLGAPEAVGTRKRVLGLSQAIMIHDGISGGTLLSRPWKCRASGRVANFPEGRRTGWAGSIFTLR